MRTLAFPVWLSTTKPSHAILQQKMATLSRQLISCPIAFRLLLLFACLSAVNGHPQGYTAPSEIATLHIIETRENESDQVRNGQPMYGLGVRIGSYLQGFAFVVGILTLDSVDPKTQFSGIVLALQLTITWFWRLASGVLSGSELWVGLAQLLIITTPGAFLLFLSFSYQRRHWKTKDGKEMLRKEIIRGGGVNFIQVLLVLLLVQIVNIYFAVIVTFKKPPLESPYEDPIWMWKTWQARDSVLKLFLWIQSVATAVLVGCPYLFYAVALYKYRRPLRGHGYDPIDNYERKDLSFMHRVLNSMPYGIKGFAIFLIAAAALFYVAILIISIERTILAAKLRSLESFADPGQLLPLITGILSFLSSAANFTNEQWLKIAYYPVRIDTVRSNKTLVFYKDGKLLNLPGYQRIN
ncbi:hypothetical protein K431DRAFT_310783 [Polychaeton citri CBS 116435]|uniref:Uncharacterized protein n=1 Tax=Polychaeton citri CBS 116435 TaxID=1314669 RepID=A0A9P4QF00_9PEZI|nr:hypothetical protein K431DRAFT_310783 [Polychaeton citri CBS 116435]